MHSALSYSLRKYNVCHYNIDVVYTTILSVTIVCVPLCGALLTWEMIVKIHDVLL